MLDEVVGCLKAEIVGLQALVDVEARQLLQVLEEWAVLARLVQQFCILLDLERERDGQRFETEGGAWRDTCDDIVWYDYVKPQAEERVFRIELHFLDELRM